MVNINADASICQVLIVFNRFDGLPFDLVSVEQIEHFRHITNGLAAFYGSHLFQRQ